MSIIRIMWVHKIKKYNSSNTTTNIPILNANSCKFSPIILIGCLFIAVFELKLWQGKGLITMQNAINHHATGVTVSGSKCIVKEFPVERQLTPSNSPRVTSYSQLSTSLCHKNFLSFILPFFLTLDQS